MRRRLKSFFAVLAIITFFVINVVFIVLVACKVYLPVFSELLDKNLWKESMYNTKHLFFADILPTLWMLLWWACAGGIFIGKALILRIYDEFVTWLAIIADFIYPFALFTFLMFMSRSQNFSNVFFLACFCISLVLTDWIFFDADYSIGKIIFGLLFFFLIALLLFFINWLYLLNQFLTVIGGIMLAALLIYVIAGFCGASDSGNGASYVIVAILEIE